MEEIDLNELYERIFDLEDRLYQNEDKVAELVLKMCHTHITIGEMEELYEFICRNWKIN